MIQVLFFADGILTQYLNRQILLFSFVLLKSLTIFLVPHWTSVYQFYGNAFFNGFFTAAICVMVNVWLNELWSWSAKRRKLEALNPNQIIDHSHMATSSKIDIGNVLMQALHFFFGIGTILGPYIAEPFLRRPFIGNAGFVSNCLVWPYFIASMSGLVSTASFFILFLFYPYEQADYSKKTSSSNEDSDNARLIPSEDETPNAHVPLSRKYLKHAVITVSSLFLFVFLCSEGTYFQYSASFVTKSDLHPDESTAALYASAIPISFTIFRGMSIFLALKLTPEAMILIDLIIVLAGNLMVFFFVNTNAWLLVFGFVLLGAGFSSVFPSYFPFLERHGFVVTDLIGSILTFSAGVSLVLAPSVIALYIDTTPMVLVYFTFGSVLLSFVMLFGVNTLIKLHKRVHEPSTAINNDVSSP